MISDDAVEAAAAGMWGHRPMQRTSDGAPLPFSDAKVYQRTRYLDQARAALEAAAPILLNDTRPMTLVEIAARDRPESMEKAREKVRAERRESQSDTIRQAQEVAWAKGATSAGMNLMTLQAAGINPNPYSKEPKHSMHAPGEWFYACEACSGLPDGDRQ